MHVGFMGSLEYERALLYFKKKFRWLSQIALGKKLGHSWLKSQHCLYKGKLSELQNQRKTKPDYIYYSIETALTG